MLGHTTHTTFADSTGASKSTKMNIDFLVSTDSSEADKEPSQNTVANLLSPPTHRYSDQELPFRDLGQPIRAQSYPQGANSFPSLPPPTAPPYLERTIQPYWVQGACAAPQIPPTRSRLSSVSSASTGVGESHRHKRAARPKYDMEMAYFIWFHRSDLGLSWDDVNRAFNKQFPQIQDRAIPGIQSKFYRVLKDHRVPMIRAQRKGRSSSRDAYHDIKFCEWVKGVHYAWMDNRLPKIEHIRNLPAAAAVTASQPRSRL